LKLVKMFEQKKSGERNQESENNFAVIWFENRLNEARADVNSLMNQFHLSEALKTIYSLIWVDFCSWYLEWIKPGFEQSMNEDVYNKTVYFFEELIQLLHSYMPFITEEIYHLLRERKDGDDLSVKQFEAIREADKTILLNGMQLQKDITAIRDARKKNQIKNAEKIKFSTVYHVKKFLVIHPHILEILQKQTNTILSDADLKNDFTETIKNEIPVFASGNKFYLHVEREVNKDLQKEELLKDLEYQNNFLNSVLKKLSNERFVQNAKPEVVALERKKQADAEARIKTIKESLQNLD
jgi:valyl-tRNA synthetase